MTCAQIDATYQAAVKKAKACSTLVIKPCSSKVDATLNCPCPTFINPANTAATLDMAAAKKAWTLQGCKSGPICSKCPLVSSGLCVAAVGSKGSCVDK